MPIVARLKLKVALSAIRAKKNGVFFLKNIYVSKKTIISLDNREK